MLGWPAHIPPHIEAAQKYNLPPEVLFGILKQESGGAVDITGYDGHGQGRWQIDDRFHGAFLRNNASGRDIPSATDCAARLLREYTDALGGDLRLGVSAYNAGVGGVQNALRQGRSADSATTGGNYAARGAVRARPHRHPRRTERVPAQVGRHAVGHRLPPQGAGDGGLALGHHQPDRVPELADQGLEPDLRGRHAQAPRGHRRHRHRSQYRPAGAERGYYNGPSNCGPTSMAMIARAFGYGAGMTDAQLINHLGQQGGTSAAGTSVNGIVAMAQAMGKQGQIRGPGANADWIREQLQQGKKVVANGDRWMVVMFWMCTDCALEHGPGQGTITLEDPATRV
jgi:hypothetical protein